jgi:RimJ/RimL family protein N-acetyltransferase
MFFGPFKAEIDFRKFIEEMQNAADEIFFAIVPVSTGKATGFASFMRIVPQHLVLEVGHILYSPSLQKSRVATEVMYLMA